MRSLRPISDELIAGFEKEQEAYDRSLRQAGGQQVHLRRWSKITSHHRCSSRVFHPILRSTHTPWRIGPKISHLEIGCRHLHFCNPSMRQLSVTAIVLLQGQMRLRDLPARLTWRIILRRRDRGEQMRRSASEPSTTGFRVSSSLIQTHNRFTTHSHLQDQEGHPKHNGDLGTLSSPSILSCISDFYFILLRQLFASVLCFSCV